MPVAPQTNAVLARMGNRSMAKKRVAVSLSLDALNMADLVSTSHGIPLATVLSNWLDYAAGTVRREIEKKGGWVPPKVSKATSQNRSGR